MYREDTILILEYEHLPKFKAADLVLAYQLGPLSGKIITAAVLSLLFIAAGSFYFKQSYGASNK